MTLRFIRYLLLLALIAALGCSTGGSDLSPVAGGTGAGNPGGATSLCFLADTSAPTPVLPKVAVPPPQAVVTSALDDTTDPSVVLHEADGLEMVVTSCVIVVDRIQFLFDSPQDCESLVDESYEGLECRSGGITVEGSHAYDALTGQALSPTAGFILPQTAYSGVKLYTSKDDAIPERPAIELAGTFVYKGKTRNFQISADINSLLSYSNPDGPFEIASGTHTKLTILLAASEWLDEVYIRDCLNSGDLPLTPGGDLVIDETVGEGPCSNTASTIHTNIVKSGSLQVEVTTDPPPSN